MTQQYTHNHYVPEWYQYRFLPNDGRQQKLFYKDLNPDPIPNTNKRRKDLLRWGPPTCFAKDDLYTVAFGSWKNVDIERQFFGPIDRNGEAAIDYFTNFTHPSVNPKAFHHFLEYMSVQKLRTPKGLGWLSQQTEAKNPLIDLILMQKLKRFHCALWAESVWQIADAEHSRTKFIISDHPVTVYNRACYPLSKWCKGFNDPDIWLNGTHTIFPLSLNKLMIFTNLSWVRNPYQSEVRARPNPNPLRGAVFNFTHIQTHRSLSEQEVREINYIMKRRAHRFIAAAEEEWLYPEEFLENDHWRKFGDGYLLMPDPRPIYMGGEITVGYENGSSDVWSEYGHKPGQLGFRDKKRHDREAETLYRFKGEFAYLYGPKRRGRTFQAMNRLDAEQDSEQFHKRTLRHYLDDSS